MPWVRPSRREERGRAGFELGGHGPTMMGAAPRKRYCPRVPPGEQSLHQASASPAHAPRHGHTAEAAHGNHPWGILMRTYLCAFPEKRWIQTDAALVTPLKPEPLQS